MTTSERKPVSLVGRCACGCGRPTRCAPRTDKQRGWIRGKPLRYVHGHHMRGRSRPDRSLAWRTTKNPRWRGGRSIHRNGYVWVRLPDDHPLADIRSYCLEHRLVMSQTIGRFVTADEVVHHINGIKDDNRPCNLKLYESQSEHVVEEHCIGGQFR